jgi:hypothetical protein
MGSGVYDLTIFTCYTLSGRGKILVSCKKKGFGVIRDIFVLQYFCFSLFHPSLYMKQMTAGGGEKQDGGVSKMGVFFVFAIFLRLGFS